VEVNARLGAGSVAYGLRFEMRFRGFYSPMYHRLAPQVDYVSHASTGHVADKFSANDAAQVWVGDQKPTRVTASTIYGPQNNGGRVNYHINTSSIGNILSVCILAVLIAVPVVSLHCRRSPTPLPSPPRLSTIPFRRDPSFVHRPVLDDVWNKTSQSGARVALVGLGGVG
jgi:hypothetical protein